MLYVLDIRTGKEIKKIEVGSYIGNNIAADQGVAYVAHYGNKVAAFALGDGRQLWEFGERDFPFYAAPAVSGNWVIAGSRDKRVYGIDRAKGEREMGLSHAGRRGQFAGDLRGQRTSSLAATTDSFMPPSWPTAPRPGATRSAPRSRPRPPWPGTGFWSGAMTAVFTLLKMAKQSNRGGRSKRPPLVTSPRPSMATTTLPGGPITHLSDKKSHHATEAGNYFVANYPPFSFWQKEQAFAVEQGAGLARRRRTCRSAFTFTFRSAGSAATSATSRSTPTRTRRKSARYIDAGMAEFARYATRPYIEGRKPNFVYFGGGTPSYLCVPQLRELTDRMKELLPWDEAEEVAFEAEPGTLNEKKLEAIREIGVTRLSLGVEHFDDHILESNGRAHRCGEIDRAYRFARGLGFEQINIDLIAGMMDETEENWKLAVAKAVAMQPDCVTIYQMEVPYNTGIYKQMKAEGKVTAPVADWETKRGWVNYAFDEFEKAGYTVTSAYTVVKNPDKIKFVYRDSLWEGADLIAVGRRLLRPSRRRPLPEPGGHPALTWRPSSAASRAIFRAYATSPDERFLREFILKLKLGAVQPSYYQGKFGEDVLTRFAPQLDGCRTRVSPRSVPTKSG